jgi:phenylacetic acid degradation operon negative regulatory protein
MRPPRSKSLIFDIYGGFVRPLGGWIAIADLITLMDDLGVDQQTVRSSVSRMSRKGMLVRRRLADRSGYELSPQAEAILEEGDQRIFAGTQPAVIADGWALAVFSVPEDQRGKRHQLRSQLTWLGFGNLGGGVWLAPRRVLERGAEAVRRLQLEQYVDLFEAHYREFDELRALVDRCWDLDRVGGLYAEFVETVTPLLGRWRRSGTADRERLAFIDFTTVLHRWRKMPYLDPGLPLELLPGDWRGTRAAELFGEVVDRLEKPALGYVERLINGSS